MKWQQLGWEGVQLYDIFTTHGATAKTGNNNSRAVVDMGNQCSNRLRTDFPSPGTCSNRCIVSNKSSIGNLRTGAWSTSAMQE